MPQDELRGIVQRMIEAGEPEENIATVIQHFSAQSTPEPKWYEPGGDTVLDNVRSVAALPGKALDYVRGHPAQAGAMAGGIAAVPLTGGASMLPAMAAAGLGGAGGAGLGMIAGAAAGSPNIPSTPGGVLGTMASQGAQQAGMEGVGQVAPAMLRGSMRLMQSALKPTQSLANARPGAGFGTKEAIAEAVLKEGRIVSPGSLANAQGTLDATDEAAHVALQNAADQGVRISPRPVRRAIQAETTTGPFGKQINASPDVSAIRGVDESFATNPHWPAIDIRRPITEMVIGPMGKSAETSMQVVNRVQQPADAVTAHEFAMNTGKNLKGKFGRLGGATVEAEKAGREAITSQLREKTPELRHLWDAEAQQITARDAIEQAVGRRSNTDPIGLGGIIGMVKNPALAATAMVDRSALWKSILAQGLYKGRGMTPTANQVRAAVMAILSGSEPPKEP